MAKELIALPDGVRLTQVGLKIDGDLPLKKWEGIGRLLQQQATVVRWSTGDWLNYGETKYGEAYAQALDETRYEYQTINALKYVASRFEFMRRRINLTWSHHREVAAMEPAEADRLLEKAEEEGWSHKCLREEVWATRTKHDLIEAPSGKFRCIVIDPPWPIEKIMRDVVPTQGRKLDYPIMDIEEIAKLPVGEIADERGCHLYMWTTQRFLVSGEAFHVMAEWGFDPSCVMVWHKNGGFTPTHYWQYNAEFVVFARIGGLKLKKAGIKLVFNGKRRAHSQKPDEFYELVKEASPGPRIDMFSREKRDGFGQWGNETDKL